MIYLLGPNITKCALDGAPRFCAECERMLRRHVPTSPLDTEAAVRMITPTGAETVIFFNPETGTALPPAVTRLVRGAKNVFPVAMTTSARKPPDAASSRQSFDVVEFLALRGGEANTEAAGAAFAREVLAAIHPSLWRSHMALFLSHRRVDGEQLARDFWKYLSALRQQGFRDLADLNIGADAQQTIEQSLRESDAVIFFDTPLAATSEWVGHEIRMALRGGIPIVWIKAGTHALPEGFPQPARTPHFTIPGTAVTLADATRAVEMAGDVVGESAVQVLEARARLTAIDGIDVEENDGDRLVYSVRIDCGRRSLTRRHVYHSSGAVLRNAPAGCGDKC